MKRRIYTLPNKDKQLGDYPVRMDKDGLNLAWIVTHSCFLNCPYCVGWKDPKQGPTLIDKLGGVDKTVEALLRFRDVNKKNLYITMSGGEPTQVPLLPDLINKLNKNDVFVELHTNLTTSKFSRFIGKMIPEYTGQVMATYHGWKLDKNKNARDLYFRNFKAGWDAGYTMVLKTVVLPTELKDFAAKKKELQKLIPKGAPILPWVFIHGSPKSPTNAAGTYPQAYTKEERIELHRVTEFRALEQQMYCLGAGFFKGMACGGGSSYAYMDINGNIFPCFARASKRDKFGNIEDKRVVLNSDATKCPKKYCGTPFWGLWYGENPWDYIPKATKDSSYYCRYGNK